MKETPQRLAIDTHTFRDLEIFDSGSEEPSLFEFCNETRSQEAQKQFKRRFEYPWSDPERINDTQQAIRFIINHRALFEGLPSTYVMNRAEHYRQEVLPMIEARGSLEFGLSTVALWLNQRSHFTSMMLGVQVTQRFIQTLLVNWLLNCNH